MKSRYLFPYWARFAGYACILTAIILFFINEDGFQLNVTLLIIIGLLLIAFSKEKFEDEHIAQLRLESLQWAIYINYALLLVSLIIYKGNNLNSVVHFNLRFPLLFFILRFKWVLFRLNQLLRKEASLK